MFWFLFEEFSLAEKKYTNKLTLSQRSNKLVPGANEMMLDEGVIHFFKKIADNLLNPMSSKMSMSFFLQSKRN